MHSRAPRLPCSPLPSPVRQRLAEVEELQTEAVLEDAAAACGDLPLPGVACNPDAPVGSALVPVGVADGHTGQEEGQEVDAEAALMVPSLQQPGPKKAASGRTPFALGIVKAGFRFAWGCVPKPKGLTVAHLNLDASMRTKWLLDGKEVMPHSSFLGANMARSHKGTCCDADPRAQRHPWQRRLWDRQARRVLRRQCCREADQGEVGGPAATHRL